MTISYFGVTLSNGWGRRAWVAVRGSRALVAGSIETQGRLLTSGLEARTIMRLSPTSAGGTQKNSEILILDNEIKQSRSS